MPSMSDFLENKVIDHLLRNQAYTPPTTVYVALYTTMPNKETGASGVEVTGGSYARQAVTLSAGSGGSSANTAALSYSNMPAATVLGVGLFDALTGGNMLMSDVLTTNKTVAAGDTLSFATSSLTVAFD